MSEKFVLYKRTNKAGTEVKYIVKTQFQYGEIWNRVGRADHHEREVLAESDDLGLLYKMKELAKGVDDE